MIRAKPYFFKEHRYAGQDIIMCHYPLGSWRKLKQNSWNLHGHCHGNYEIYNPFSKNLPQLDVGVDSHNFYPLSFDELKEKISLKLNESYSTDKKFQGDFDLINKPRVF